jgi:hypothetical protein
VLGKARAEFICSRASLGMLAAPPEQKHTCKAVSARNIAKYMIRLILLPLLCQRDVAQIARLPAKKRLCLLMLLP